MAQVVVRSSLARLSFNLGGRGRSQGVRQCYLYINHVRSLHTSVPISSVEKVKMVERESVTHGTPLTFPSRFLSLLRDGEEGVMRRRREDVGGVREREQANARTDLLEALESADSHLLSPEKVAAILCQHYQGLGGDMEQRQALISVLASDLAVDHSAIEESANHLTQLCSEGRSEATLLRSESNLRHVLTPFYAELFTHISKTEGGIKWLVDLRADILDVLKSGSDPASWFLLAEMNSHLRDLLSQWFSTGLLDVQQLTWESPCDIMEKVSEYEAVHRVRHWQELKHRVSRHRRCFVFTHPSLPREPLVVLHVALTSEPSSNIQTVLDRSLQGGDMGDVTTAVFYSIRVTQRGLSGIDLGYFLIKRVVGELQREFPGQLTTFVTLSPIPGFRKWLESQVKESLLTGNFPPSLSGGEGRMADLCHLFPGAGSSTHALQMALAKKDWTADKEGPLAAALKAPLSSLCAWYLVNEKHRGKALDPVARFHLNSGASVWRLNWLADVSPLGLQNSFGLMCNYLYALPDLVRNSDSYQVTGTIARSANVQGLLDDWKR